MPMDTQELATRVQARLAEVTEALGDDLPSLSRAMHEELASEITELDGDHLMLDLLRASSESNVETFLHYARYDIPLEEIAAPPAALEYGRRLAQRGISSNALQRAYRLGQRHVMRMAQAEIARTEPDREVALAAGVALLERAFAYVDLISEKVVTEYEEERERWLTNRTTVRATALRTLLTGEEPDLAGAEQALGYRLRQHHLGVVAWSLEKASGVAQVRDLESLVGAVAQALGAGTPLFMPQDGSVAWAWIPLGRQSDRVDADRVAAVVREHSPQVRLALGSTGAAVPGFVATHREAMRAHLVATTAAASAEVVTAWSDPGVRSAAVLAKDLGMTRELVAAALGPLGADDDGMERLRETLRIFLDERRSYLATAEKVHLHKNTVKYRVDKAVEARGRSLDEDRLDLELALLACRYLGPGVLTS
ncbi:DNA-binding PucR family transcriptional regulator [Nocardioides sp. BE266]|uniref:PucR family transcriptional regulator n=1 Tax=Nocardioides sp. BE266 TaxID=2817725 RepID=UPI00285A4EE2|nr:helix-turn-helix domain-containing protein [Nocardioides sp. BE266]MDR7252386.1 DNA-binding PucR family transcriptional regulator [Nocardioides sp. BE266]